ncbi:outer membrane protein assembly factor BamB family protein [Halorhabdus salina]|uniref:outer membrane protein assembly factor BamB family protein n=1 Tax=Halorhabdus salina TaxID=2750670 RepID=UPI0015EF74A1
MKNHISLEKFGECMRTEGINSSRRGFLAVAGSVLLAGCSEMAFSGTSNSTTPTSWPSVQANTQNTGFTDGALPSNVSETWIFSTGRGWLSPIITDGGVVTGTVDGVGMVELETGGLRWEHGVGGVVSASPTASAERVYVPVQTKQGSQLLAYHTRDKEPLWTVDLPDEKLFSPSVSDRIVFVRTSERLLWIDSESGDVLHQTDVPTFEVGAQKARKDISIAIDESRVYVPNENSVSAYSRESRTHLWTVPSRKVRASPTVHESTVVVAGVNDGILAVAADTGEVQQHWRDPTPWTSPAATDTALYATDGFAIVKIDPETGKRISKHDLQGDIYSSPVVVGDTVIAGSIGRGLMGLGRDLQSQRWVMDEAFNTESTPAVANGHVVVNHPDGTLRGYHFEP